MDNSSEISFGSNSSFEKKNDDGSNQVMVVYSIHLFV